MTDVQTPASKKPATAATYLVADLRTNSEVLEALAGLDGVLDAHEPAKGEISPRQVAAWAHACALAHATWGPEEMVSAEDYIDAVEEAVGLPVGGHCPAGGHKPDPKTPKAIAAAIPPAPKHRPDPRNPVPSSPLPMRPAL